MTVDPDNRLVADNLEADWNDKLRAAPSRQDEYEHATAAATPSSPTSTRPGSVSSPPTSPGSGPTRAPRNENASGSPACCIEDVTINKTDQIHLHVRFRGGQTTSLTSRSRSALGRRDRRTPTRSPCSTACSTPTPTLQAADALNADGHRSGTDKPFTARSCWSYAAGNGLPSHLERLRAHGLLTIPEVAERLGVHQSTIKAWHRAGLLALAPSQRQEHPALRTPYPRRPSSRQTPRKRIEQREPTQPSTGGAYETNALS